MNFFYAYKNPITILLVLIIMGGFLAFDNLQTALFPEITFPKIKVIVDTDLQPVSQMMVTVTKPIENAIKKIPGLKLLRSTTSRGSCEISAFLDWKSDIDLSQQQIESKINQIRNSLPANVQITIEKMNPSILPVMGFTLESNSRSSIELKQLALFTIKPFLSQVDGVSEVRVIGGKTKEYQIILDIQKMSSLSLTQELISKALSQTNFIKSNGYLSDYRFLYLTLTDASIYSVDALKNCIISNNGKRVVRLKDIAAVEINEATEYTKINANGKNGILLAVVKQPNANLVMLSDQVLKKVSSLKHILPNDVSVVPYYIQADFVNTSIKNVSDSLLIGLILAILVTIIFLRSVKASATILITIPVTLCLTIAVLYLIGYTLNIMTLGAMAAAIGLIIDDAIVVVEQIHRTKEEHPEEKIKVVLRKSISYLFPAMLGSSLCTIVIFLPFVFMSGVAGAYFKVLTDTMIITLICSFFVTWIGLPVIYLKLTKKEKLNISEKAEVTVSIVKNQKWVSFFIMRPLMSISFIILLACTIFYVFPKLETGFLPEMDEGSIVLDYSSPPGTSLEETDRMLREVEKIIVDVKEVETYSRRTGTQMGFFITEPNRGDYLIQLKSERTRTTEEVISEIRKKIENTQPALRVDFGQVIGDMLGDLMTSVQPIEIKLFGDNQKKLQELSRNIADVVSSVKGTADVFDGIIIAGPSVIVKPTVEKLAQFGLTPADLQYQLQTSLEGNIVGNVLEKDQLTGIRMLYPGSKKLNVQEMKKLNVFLQDGKLTPINRLASIDLNTGDAEIERENLQSMGVVSARLDNRDLGSVIQDIQKNIASKINLPLGYDIQYGGSFAEQQKSFNELLLILITSSLLVFCVILFMFKEFGISLLILLTAIMGISGSYLALFITNTPLNVGSYTGLIMIVGIIAENAIFTFLQFKESLLTKSVDESIIFSISTRLRPKLMTALGAIIALMPLALGIGSGAQLHQPLAIAVIGGFLVALPLLLIVFPSMLRILYAKKVN
ncbi:efflux RND transporter permease subunit [soil metagenome]